jgi:RNA polymerase sigma-70 factor (ECF subfamily)
MTEDAVIGTYRATIRPLYAYISRRVGGDVALAQDVAQETWMRALDAWPRRGVPDEPLAWLIRVARNCLVSHFRRVRFESVDPEILDLEPSALSELDPEHAAIVGWGLARLRRAHAEILEAFYFEQKSVKEIAAERSTSERAIEGRLRRARERLRKKLERRVRASSSVKRMSHADEASAK